jgi:hypothetical protein
VGLPSGLSVGAGVNYGFKNNNWTFTANTTFAGFYSYGGYDTKAGFIGGGGFGISPALTGNFGVSNNLFSVGFNYSQNGGWSASALGFSYSNQGLIFDPSITVSVTIEFYSDYFIPDSWEPCKMSESCFKSKDAALNDLANNGFTKNSHKINEFDYRNREPSEENYGGITFYAYVNGKLNSLSITMFPHKTIDGFYESFNHELIHAYDHVKYGNLATKSYRETKAYMWTDRFREKSTLPYDIPKYTGKLDLFDIPDYLVTTLTPNPVDPKLYKYLPNPPRISTSIIQFNF